MATEHMAPILELVQNTPNTRAGIGKVVRAVIVALQEIDSELVDLLAQHGDLGTIVRQYVSLHEMLVGEEVRSKQEISEITALPTGFKGIENARERVLLLADQSGLDEIQDETVLSWLRDREVALPWRNPKAVIATILTRSGRWTKKEPGKYVRVRAHEG